MIESLIQLYNDPIGGWMVIIFGPIFILIIALALILPPISWPPPPPEFKPSLSIAAEEKYRELWKVVNSWADIQLKHPGALPDVQALKSALERRKPE